MTVLYQNMPIIVSDDVNYLARYLPYHSPESVFIITDHNVYAHWQSLFADFSVIILPAGEAQKSLLQIEAIIEELIKRGADRNSFLVGIGGGVICDITGFVASIYMRGIDFAFVPTTLLAQVDAAIGGKNGVNTSLYKNMIGVFNQPQFIFSDPQLLNTLPHDTYIDGLAEVVKHACIKSLSYFEYLEQHVTAILARDEVALRYIISESVAIKSAVVASDPYEKGERKHLNFGHTFGHAIEKSQAISHGKAVSLGIIIANRIAVKLGLLSAEKAQRIKILLDKLGLPTHITVDIKNLYPLVKKDKKKSGNLLSLILLNDVGSSIIYTVDASIEDIFSFGG